MTSNTTSPSSSTKPIRKYDLINVLLDVKPCPDGPGNGACPYCQATAIVEFLDSKGVKAQ